MGRRRTIGLHVAVLCAIALLASACPIPIGSSGEGRPIVVQSFGSGPRDVLFIGGLHTGPEDNTRVLAEGMAAYFAQYPYVVPAGVTLHIITSANPDGTARGVHTNAYGVDLNRNWPADNWRSHACHPTTGCREGLGGPAPLSEPETNVLYRHIEAIRPDVTAVWHSEAALVEANEVPGAEAYARVYGNAAGYPYLEEWQAYEITGQLIDALEQRLGLPAFDIELAECCVVTGDDFERNWRGVLALLAAVDAASSSPTPTPTPRTGRATPTKTRTPGPVIPDRLGR